MWTATRDAFQAASAMTKLNPLVGITLGLNLGATTAVTATTAADGGTASDGDAGEGKQLPTLCITWLSR